MATKIRENKNKGSGASVPFDSIEAPGTYYSNWTGHLIRVPEEALSLGHSPTLEIIGTQDMMVTRLSQDPFLPLNKARMVAADLDLEVKF